MRYAILAVAILLALHGCVSQPPGNQTGNQTNVSVNGTNNTLNQTGNQTPPQGNQTDGLTEEMCNGAGGHWNTQGTCCRDLQPGQVCNKLCVAVCDCGGIAGFRCPSGYYCTDYYPNSTTPDAMGVCKKAG